MKTQYSRRELYALGEPLGEAATRKENGRIIYGGGGGGGPQKSEVTQTNIPEYARPYVETMLGAGQQQIFDYEPAADRYEDVPVYGPAGRGPPVQIGTERKLIPGGGDMVPTRIKPYTPFSQDPNAYFAGFSPMQEQSFSGAANLGVSPEMGQASEATSNAMNRAMNARYQTGQFGNQFQGPGDYQTGQFNAANVQGPALQDYEMQGPQDVQSQQFGQQAAQQYMSPYMQSVVDIQQRDAQRQADVARTGRGAQAVQSGAFGGSRQAIMEAEAARNLAQQKGDIQAQGLQSAFGQAQQQYNADQAQRMQAALANQGMGYNVGSQNLAAKLGIQQLGAGQNLQAQLANQQMGMNAQQMAEQSRQYGAGQGLNAAQLRAQYGLAGQQAAEQSRQYGAGLGMQGIQTALSGAGQLGNLGQNIYGQRVGNIQLQNQLGGQQQALEQAKINQQVQDYGTAQQYPLMQLANMNNLLRGLPMQSSTVQTYQAPPSPLSQLAGAGATAYGAYKMFGAPGGAKGGSAKDIKKKRPAGLAELALIKMQ